MDIMKTEYENSSSLQLREKDNKKRGGFAVSLI